MTITIAPPWDGRPSRRAVLAVTGLSGLALAAGSKGAFGAAAENVLKVGFVSPRTGALAGFGQTDGYVPRPRPQGARERAQDRRQDL